MNTAVISRTSVRKFVAIAGLSTMSLLSLGGIAQAQTSTNSADPSTSSRQARTPLTTE